MPQRPSIKDIARIADVSASTVSRALAGSTRVSSSTRQRIHAIAQDLGYTPSLAARSLVMGSSPIIGVISPTLSDPYIASVMKGLEEASHAAGYQRLVASTQGNAAREIEMVRMLLGHNVAGLIILSSRAQEAYRELLQQIDSPVIFVNSLHTGESVYNVATDNEYGGWLATHYLLQQGHQRIAHLAGPARGRSQIARAAGYRRALEEAGLAFAQHLVLPGDGSIESGRTMLHWWLELTPQQRPSAIFCYNDLSALGLLSAAHQQGIRIPEQLSVIGFDNAPMSEISIPPLTTVEQRTWELGRLAVSSLLTALAHKPVTDIFLRGELIVRASVRQPDAQPSL
jgi:DNA-binding LacI/PurR family transcriptional regulator